MTFRIYAGILGYLAAVTMHGENEKTEPTRMK